LGLASLEYRRGLALTAEAKWEDAYSAFERAQLYYPYVDNIYTSRADLLRHMIAVLPASALSEKRAMFEEADKVLARAEELNPLRPQIFSTRAVLYEGSPTLAGPDWVDAVLRNHRRAVELEPRSYQARFLYANFLVQHGRQEEARQVLEEGMKYVYFDNELIVPYYTLTAKLRVDAGDRDGAALLQRKVDAIKKTVLLQKGKLPL
jgi:tetratricopeptide (TPR) repeat protein